MLFPMTAVAVGLAVLIVLLAAAFPALGALVEKTVPDR
jgi:hypothetical protein